MVHFCRDDFKYSPQGENIKKDIVITAKMRCLPIKKKEYSGISISSSASKIVYSYFFI